MVIAIGWIHVLFSLVFGLFIWEKIVLHVTEHYVAVLPNAITCTSSDLLNCLFQDTHYLRGLSLFIGMGGYDFTRGGHHIFLLPIGGVIIFFLHSIGGGHHFFFFWRFHKMQNKRSVYHTIQNLTRYARGSSIFSSFRRGGVVIFFFIQ